MRFDVVENPSKELLEEINFSLRAYNREKNPAFFAARDQPEHAPRPLHVVAYDDTGEVAGGLIGESQFAWLHVEILAVRADLRRQGVGKHLLQVAEEEARRRGCKRVFLDTMSYQAPEFYHKQGYQTAGEIADWDSHGHTRFYLIKTL